MAYVIAEPCIGTKDSACVDACPVDCIHPKKDSPKFEGETMLYIDPVECIDCGACVPVCPVSAIFALDDLPEKWNDFAKKNAEFRPLRAGIRAGSIRLPDSHICHFPWLDVALNLIEDKLRNILRRRVDLIKRLQFVHDTDDPNTRSSCAASASNPQSRTACRADPIRPSCPLARGNYGHASFRTCLYSCAGSARWRTCVLQKSQTSKKF